MENNDRWRKLISYIDRMLRINEAHIVDSDQEDWMDEEAEEVVLAKDQDPLCLIVPISLEERCEWCKPWKSSLIINLLGKKINFRYLKHIFVKLLNQRVIFNLLMLGMVIM